MCDVSEQCPVAVYKDCASKEDNGTDDTIYQQSIKTQKRRIKMYKCRCCGAIFEEPRIRKYKEAREYWGMSCYEEFYEETCPECDDYDFREYDEDEEEEEEDELC